MENQTPLLLIALVLTGFWVIGKIVSRSHRDVEEVIAEETRGTKICDNFHIANLEHSEIEILVQYLRNNQEEEVGAFIARYRPVFVELDDYLDTLYEQYLRKLTKGYEFSTEHDKSAVISFLNLDKSPDSLRFNTITQPMLRNLVEHRKNGKRFLTREFIEKFGGQDFMKNFVVYMKYCKELPVTMRISKNHEDRKVLEKLVASGMALQGRKIHLRDRLNVLQLSQLIEMSKELKIDKSYANVEDAANTLAEIPGSAVLLAMIYSVDEIFLVKAEDDIDPNSILKEWSVMQAYSTLLCRSLTKEQLAVLIL